MIEKSGEYQLPLVIGFIDYEKAFDSIEHFSIFEALRKMNVNETYVKILENIYKGATARVHLVPRQPRFRTIFNRKRCATGGSNSTKVIYCSD